LEHFCSAQLDHKQSSIENICRVNLSLDLTNLNHPCFDTDIKASLPCQPKPTLEPSNPSGSTLEIGKKEHGPTKSRNMLMTLFLEQKIGVDPLLTPDSTTGLSKSISKTHNKESPKSTKQDHPYEMSLIQEVRKDRMGFREVL